MMGKSWVRGSADASSPGVMGPFEFDGICPLRVALGRTPWLPTDCAPEPFEIGGLPEFAGAA